MTNIINPITKMELKELLENEHPERCDVTEIIYLYSIDSFCTKEELGSVELRRFAPRLIKRYTDKGINFYSAICTHQ